MDVEQEINVLKAQIAALEKALNEVRLAVGWPKIHVPKGLGVAPPPAP